jgi:hypothetical protein
VQDGAVNRNLLAAKLVTSSDTFASIPDFVAKLDDLGATLGMFTAIGSSVKFLFTQEVLSWVATHCELIESRHWSLCIGVAVRQRRNDVQPEEVSDVLSIGVGAKIANDHEAENFDCFVIEALNIAQFAIGGWMVRSLATRRRQPQFDLDQLGELSELMANKLAQRRLEGFEKVFVNTDIVDWADTYKRLQDNDAKNTSKTPADKLIDSFVTTYFTTMPKQRAEEIKEFISECNARLFSTKNEERKPYE